MKIWTIAILFMIFFTPLAKAHPHVFITPKAVITINNHAVSQIDVEWDLDAMSSSLYLESCGSDSSEIWKILFPETQLLVNGSYTPRAGYYTTVEIDGTPIANVIPSNFQTSYVDGSLHCQFTLYVNQHVNNSLRIWFDDSTIYNAFDVQGENFQINDQNGVSYTIQKQNENDIDKISVAF